MVTTASPGTPPTAGTNSSSNNNNNKLLMSPLSVIPLSRLHLTDFVIGIVLAIVTLATVIGNALVIAAILRERHLRSVGNYLVFSLAVADLMVACLVMPLGALYVVTGQWTLGAAFCDLWTTVDVLCCTASILHLLAIAIDRFWAVTNVDYIHQRRNGRRIGLMILLIWAASIVISLAPIFGWRDPDFPVRIAQRQCLISQDVTYQIFATCASFYVPLALILLLYWRIYQVARKRIRRKPGNKVTLVALQSASNASNAAHVENKVLKKGRMPAEATNGGGAVLPNDGFDQPESELVIATAGDLAVVELVPVHHCNHNANGGLAQQQQQQQQIHHDHPPAALTVVNITSTTPNELPMSNNKELKEDSTSSSGSTTQPNHNHQPNHRESKGSRKRKPHKQSSEHSNPSPSPHQSRLYQKESIESKRERKAAKTLAIIT
ncbi:PREDICTED: 5-hydroxytryptamine receptor-like, partial [Rhagoletis zephyria]|uniref:5-hydroxytryptamine receptor-like n=1 Tax=Rhagoletis zephyria TaxID=28612 RepID=UPI0008119638